MYLAICFTPFVPALMEAYAVNRVKNDGSALSRRRSDAEARMPQWREGAAR
jgi:hypothetical protein